MKELFKIEDENPLGYNHYYDPLLDYVEIITEEYCPLHPYNDENGYLIQGGIGNFTYRYFHNKINKSFEHKYLENNDVQDTIKALGYDIEKFWYLLLFVYDISWCRCQNGKEFNDSPKEKIQKLFDAVIANAEFVDLDNQEASFKSPTKIILEIKGKHKIEIDDPFTIITSAALFSKQLDEWPDESVLSRRITKGLFNNGKIVHENTSNSVHIWYFASILLKFFDLNPPIKARQKKGSSISYGKKLLVSRLIYITGLSRNENFKDSDDTLKGYLKQYQNSKLNTFSLSYL